MAVAVTVISLTCVPVPDTVPKRHGSGPNVVVRRRRVIVVLVLLDGQEAVAVVVISHGLVVADGGKVENKIK